MTVVEDNFRLRTSRKLAVPVLGNINDIDNFIDTKDYPEAIEKTLDFLREFYYEVEGSTASELTDLKWNLTAPVRLIQSLARAWSLNKDELGSLLGYPSPLFVEELLGGRLTFGDNEDRADRARLMYLIHDTLSDLFVDPQDEQRWIRSPLRVLGNAAPLDYMVKNRIPGMVAVRQFVEQRLANR
jgi:Antitoxin Xre/MbcA/ParS C-terminal toxin-binding domain